ncbi:MAG TPA: Fur family transcriptional regulator [Caldisericia bacterium]|nr:transcriptional repressor [Caldisericales bacterium]HOR46955.1 Fur family transcriptional regulator [Caldisericia bacterium]HOU07505.1 Fur family transcriptional regulator [Caldisericia bacterium]HPL89264.1 Fur family transcriptional regulator [Caldisericia bacterium]HQG59238.1 Fur family transcriptional regulator [Caldisericia bacterium]
MILEQLKQAGYRITKPRKAVIALLEENDDMDAKQIYRTLKERGQDIDIATVYRVLDLLFRLGVVHRSNFTQQHAHFGFVKAVHMICKRCGKIDEKEIDNKILLDKMKDVLGDFSAQDVSVEVYGYCKTCSRSADGNV